MFVVCQGQDPVELNQRKHTVPGVTQRVTTSKDSQEESGENIIKLIMSSVENVRGRDISQTLVKQDSGGRKGMTRKQK